MGFIRVLLVGDVHGNDRFFARVCAKAREMDCEGLIQLGDFGYWEHYPQGEGFLKWCQRQLREKDLWCHWLDGNHENHPKLWETYGYDVTQLSEVRPGLYYMPRGYRFELDGVRCMAIGGAYSIDKAARTPGRSWWPEETIREQDVEAAVAGGKVDIVFSHDCPWGVDIPILRAQQKDVFPESRRNRQELTKIVKAVEPKVLIHGHYHHRYTANFDFMVGGYWHRTLIEGLSADFDPTGSTLLLDTDNIERDELLRTTV